MTEQNIHMSKRVFLHTNNDIKTKELNFLNRIEVHQLTLCREDQRYNTAGVEVHPLGFETHNSSAHHSKFERPMAMNQVQCADWG